MDLVPSLRLVLRGLQRGTGTERDLWAIWERWISEIVADFWAVARVGIAATRGLIGVVSLPRPFVFRFDLDDPHPTPWLRVKLSAAVGDALYPHPQWARLAALWEELYPPTGLEDARLTLLRRLESLMPAFVTLLINHRPARPGWPIPARGVAEPTCRRRRVWPVCSHYGPPIRQRCTGRGRPSCSPSLARPPRING